MTASAATLRGLPLKSVVEAVTTSVADFPSVATSTRAPLRGVTVGAVARVYVVPEPVNLVRPSPVADTKATVASAPDAVVSVLPSVPEKVPVTVVVLAEYVCVATWMATSEVQDPVVCPVAPQ